MEPAKLRSYSRYAICFSIGLLLAASMGLYSLELSIVAVIVTLVANGVLISYAIRGGGEYSSPGDNGGGLVVEVRRQPELDRRTCAMGYAMVPVSAISVVCLALYKADADMMSESGTASDVSSGRGQATREAAVAFLRFVGCGALIQGGDHASVRETTVLLHSKFIGAALVAVIVYIVILGLRVTCSDADLREVSSSKDKRAYARMAFGLAVVVLIFAVVGYFPLVFTSVACAVSLAASGVMLCSAVEAPSTLEAEQDPTGTSDAVNLSKRTQLQAHVFSIVTLCCLYCLGCMVQEQMADQGSNAHSKQRQQEVRLQFVGFQLAFAAATWFAFTLAVRAYFKTLDTARNERS